MKAEWIDLKDMKRVSEAQWDGWEIEEFYMGAWILWMQRGWTIGTRYRGRPKQPKTKKVVLECWMHRATGGTCTRHAGGTEFKNDTGWVRFPAGDTEGEVEV